MARKRKVSVTQIERFARCPRMDYFSRLPEIKAVRRTSYPRLLGTELHGFIREMHTGLRKTERLFRFKALKSAIGGWCNRWERALTREAERQSILVPDDDEAQACKKSGIICVVNYWKWATTQRFLQPIAYERSLSMRLRGGIEFVGVLDQICMADYEWIARMRPELVEKGRLIDGYAPAVILDYKSGRKAYDYRQYKKCATELEEARWQFGTLHESFQPTAYAMLYQANFGVLPVGFLYFHLRSGKPYFTFREERDFETLLDALQHMLDSRAVASYPKYGQSTDACRFCDYFQACRGDRPLFISRPEGMGVGGALVTLATNVKTARQAQPKLKGLRIGRGRRKIPPPPLPNEPGITLLGSGPWECDPPSERFFSESKKDKKRNGG